MTQIAIIVPVAAFLAFPVLGAFYALRARSLSRKLGALVFGFPSRAWLQFHGILIVSLFLPFLALNRDFDAMTVFAVSVLGVLCFMVSARDILYGRISGIHEFGFVRNGTVVFFDDIASVTVIDPFALSVRTRSGLRHTVIPGDEACMAALRTSLERSGKLLQ